MTYEPGIYAKGGQVRVATSPAAAVAAVFDGFKRQGDAPVAESVEAPILLGQEEPRSEMTLIDPKPVAPKPTAPKSVIKTDDSEKKSEPTA